MSGFADYEVRLKPDLRGYGARFSSLRSVAKRGFVRIHARSGDWTISARVGSFAASAFSRYSSVRSASPRQA